MNILISVESTSLQTRNKKGGDGTYQVQQAYAHTFGQDGPKRYPEEINVFPPRDNNGNPIPYQKGDYHIAPDCLRVQNGFLDLGFLRLVPVSNSVKQSVK